MRHRGATQQKILPLPPYCTAQEEQHLEFAHVPKFDEVHRELRLINDLENLMMFFFLKKGDGAEKHFFCWMYGHKNLYIEMYSFVLNAPIVFFEFESTTKQIESNELRFSCQVVRFLISAPEPIIDQFSHISKELSGQ